jgi:hypothetical protein
MIFDSGLHVDTQTDPNRRLGRLAPIDTVGFKPGEEIAARLSSLEVAPASIDFIINSHLQFRSMRRQRAIAERDLDGTTC